MLTPLFGRLSRSSLANTVAAASGRPGLTLVYGDPALARNLSGRGFRVVLATTAQRAQSRGGYTIVRAAPDAPPVAGGSFEIVVCTGLGELILGASEQSKAAGERLARWVAPLKAGGRFIMVDRIDGGLLGTRAAPSREDLCAAMLAARLRHIAQVSPRPGTIVTCGLIAV